MAGTEFLALLFIGLSAAALLVLIADALCILVFPDTTLVSAHA